MREKIPKFCLKFFFYTLININTKSTSNIWYFCPIAKSNKQNKEKANHWLCREESEESYYHDRSAPLFSRMKHWSVLIFIHLEPELIFTPRKLSTFKKERILFARSETYRK